VRSRVLHLVERANTGDRAAGQELLRRFTPLVRSLAAEWATDETDRTELEQEGLIGVVEAIRSCWPERSQLYGPGWFEERVEAAVSRRLSLAVERPRSTSSFDPYNSPWPFGPERRVTQIVDVGWHQPQRRRLTTVLRHQIAKARRGDREAQDELLAFFAPHRNWLLANYARTGAERETLEQAAAAAILDAVVQYPERYLHDPEPRLTLVGWLERTLDGNFRRRQRLWPYDSAQVYERAEYRAQWLASRHTAAHEALRVRGPAESKRGEMRTGPPSNHEVEPPPAGLDPRQPAMTLDALLVEAKKGTHDARAEVCRRFTRLVRKLTSPLLLVPRGPGTAGHDRRARGHRRVRSQQGHLRSARHLAGQGRPRAGRALGAAAGRGVLRGLRRRRGRDGPRLRCKRHGQAHPPLVGS
jgi:hypothetical protein